jgi:putative alpha-1,2-mannosidase
VRSLELDGHASTKPWLPASFVANGGRLRFGLSHEADRAWGSATADRPPTFIARPEQ